MELLEDRVTPSNIVTLATPDNIATPGTLRYAIANVGTLGNSITFSPALSGDTISLSSVLQINANITITGLGRETWRSAAAIAWRFSTSVRA